MAATAQPPGPTPRPASPWRDTAWHVGWPIALLVALPLISVIYKGLVLGYRLEDVLPDTEYHVDVTMTLDGADGRARARTFVPVSDERQRITELAPLTGGALRYEESVEGQNRIGTWTGGGVPNASRFGYAFTAHTEGVRYELDDSVTVPDEVPQAVSGSLRAEEAIQVDAPEIRELVSRIGANAGSARSRLRAIYDVAAGLRSRPFTGTTDALTALRLGEASCNGRSRLFAALARAAGIPTRLVGGIILESGRKRTSHQWVESWIGGQWVPFDPTNDHFAELPPHYLVLYRGDESLFKHTADVNFDYEFATSLRQVPPARALETFKSFNVWALFDRLELPFTLLRTVLMLPFGALLVVFFRNVIGVPTFGTFLPALIAAAAGETGVVWGLVAICIVMLTVAGARLAIHRFALLHSPTLAVLLAVVVLTMLGTAMLADRFGLTDLTRIAYFPIAVMAIASERFYLGLVETGPKKAFSHLGGTLLVVAACYLVMNSLAMQVLVSGFPELLLWAIAANMYLGRWVGMRVSEFMRFKGLIVRPGVAS